MTIDDIIRFFSGAADGQRMTDQPVTPINQVMSAAPTATAVPQAGGGRGFVNPPVVRPAAPRPAGVSVPSDDGTTPGILAQINDMQARAASLAPDNRDVGGGQNFAIQGPDRNPDNIDAGGGQNFAMQGPALAAQGPGILQRLGFQDGNQAMMALGGALMAAGSPDPAKTALGIQSNQAELAKNREAIRRANQPKFTPLQNGAFVMAEVPGMAPQILPISQVQNFIQETKKMDMMSETQKAVFLEQLKNQMKTQFEKDKAEREGATDRVQAGLNVQELNAIADSLGQTDTATGPIIGLLPKWARDIVTPGGASLQDRAERVIQGGLRATLGGQFTQAEGDRFLARAYNPRLSEEQNVQSLRTIAREIAAIQLDKPRALEYFQKNGTLEGFTPNANPSAAPATPAAPAAGGLARPANKADYDALPKGARFIAPDGKEYIK